MNKAFLLASLVVVATPVLACEPGGKTVVKCESKSGKTLEVCQLPKSMQYKFGRILASPEMKIEVPNSQMKHIVSLGSGMANAYLIFPKGKMQYIVNLEKGFEDLNTKSKEESFTAYIDVRQGSKQITTVACINTKPIIDGRDNIIPKWISYERAMELGIEP